NTLRLVHSNFRVRRIEPVRVKGKTELIQPFVVEERLSSSSRIHEKNTSRLRINMVGRANDLKKLKLLYESTFKDHKPQMALISGDVGIGKTRLLVEFGNLLEGSGEKVTIISTRGLSHATKVPFYLWRILLRNCFEVTDREPTQAATDKLTDGILSLWENDPPESKLEAEQLLGEVLGPSGHNHILTEEELKRVRAPKKRLFEPWWLERRAPSF
ncbi:MAG: ATP-binding protein, partial [Chloroflexi bacterium]|nr:ATP-binding protein [Chloroflexota bacterium]